MKRIVLLLFVALFCIVTANAQSISDLQSNYSGTCQFDELSQTLTFTGSGAITFDKVKHKGFIWQVPTTVKRISIKSNVTVDGAFHIYDNCTVEGEDKNSSVIFGTQEQRWADNRNLDEWHYCQIQVFGGTVYVQNLKIYNARSYAVRGWGPVIHMKNCSVIDDRGGWSNHSDGFSGGPGSTVDSCYFETGDDVIKVYFPNLTVSNTTIKMVQNSVPIQFGWGNYGDADAVFNNVRIIGSGGRGPDKQIIDYKRGRNVRHLTMNNCYIDNTEATLFKCEAKGATINVTINNSYVNVKKYESIYNAKGTRLVCGSTEKLTLFDCF